MSSRRQNRENMSVETPFDFFEILRTTNKQDIEKLIHLICGDEPLNYTPHSIMDYLLTRQNGKTLPICKSVIVEERYRDRDHTKALSLFYSKSFKAINTECIRLHFFKKYMTPDSFDTLNDDELAGSYLGFCVIRPFLSRRIGRTVLRKTKEMDSKQYITCRGNFTVNLAGHRIALDGTAFIEQDTLVAACASAALWMSTTTMGQRFGMIQRSTAEITLMSSQYIIGNRAMPSQGLGPEQMIHCLREMEYDPVIIDFGTVEEAKHTIYSYVESEIPPVLLCELVDGDHAITSIGHGYQTPVLNPAQTTPWINQSPFSFIRSTEWIPFFLVNDDQRGIFRKFTFIDPGPNKALLIQRLRNAYPNLDLNSLKLDTWNCPVSIDLNMPNSPVNIQGEDIANLWGIIVPLPQGVYLTAEQAERKSAVLIRHWHESNQQPISNNSVLRTYLVPSNEYKERTRNGDADPFVKSMIQSKPLPHWIWVTEISSKNAYNNMTKRGPLIAGQVVIDATSNSFTNDFLIFHYINNGHSVLTTMLPEHKDIDEPLKHFWISNRRRETRLYHGLARDRV